ncbi:MAG: V-type ATP synthase subunit I, partial [Rhodobacteraceae bacterium]
MSIAPMVRVTLCGLMAEKAAAIGALQALGALHLIPLRPPEPLTPDDPAARRRADTAFRHLQDAPEKLTPFRLGKPFDADAVIGAIIDNRLAIRRLTDRLATLDQQIAALAPWGEFRLPPPEETGGERLWLYALPAKDRAALDRVSLPWAVVGRGQTDLHVAVIAPETPPPGLLPVRPLDAGDAPLSALRDAREDAAIALEQAERARAELTRWRLILGARLAAAEDADDRRLAETQTLDADAVFAVQGWAPADAAPAVERLAEARGLALLVEPPGPDDAPPTLLSGEGARAGMGADLTRFYASPGYRSWDPSLVVFVSFAVFFAMILADAGYAVLIGALTALYWRRIGGSASGRRFRALLAALAAASFAYGVAAGSYFGFPPPEESALARFAVVDVTDFERMMRVSILVGAAHIALALSVVAWRERLRGPGVAALGWLGVMAGGLLIWLGDGGLAAAGPWTLGAGFALVFLGGLVGRPAGAGLGARIGDAFLGLTGATRLFGDLLSYLRLFALGLASASLAGTFNQLALDIHA